MKLAFYKVGNSLGFDRHSFDDMSAEQIEQHLQPLLNDDNEAAIVNLDDKESVEFFTDEYNDEIYDLGWWCVLIRDADKPKMWCVTYVGLSDSEYKANGYSEVALYATKDAAKAKLKAWRDNEIAELKEQDRDYEILEDEDDECRISWCGHGEQVRIEVHEVELNK